MGVAVYFQQTNHAVPVYLLTLVFHFFLSPSYSKTLSKLSVHAGVYNLKNPDLATQQIATISKVTLHPDYNMMSLDNDIAVLHVSYSYRHHL